MKKSLGNLVLIVAAILVAGCATTTNQEPWTTKVVTARSVVSSDEVHGISDTFTREGRIYVHAAFTGPGVGSEEPHSVQIKWFNGNTLVFERAGEYVFKRSPYYVYASTSGTALGLGNCRVELFVDGRLRGTKMFAVTEK
jgi:hypothetical protein